jgi:hypothetical protein
MLARDFCFWLQGFFEFVKASRDRLPPGLTQEQSDLIEQHLALVFAHEIDPSMGGSKEQQKLNDLHHGSVSTGNAIPRC